MLNINEVISFKVTLCYSVFVPRSFVIDNYRICDLSNSCVVYSVPKNHIHLVNHVYEYHEGGQIKIVLFPTFG